VKQLLLTFGVVFVWGFGASGCASLGLTPTTVGAEEPPLAVEIHVSGLRADDQAALKDSLCALSGVLSCEVKKEAREATYTLQYRGSLHVLQNEIAHLEHPGLTAQEVKASLRFQGFDNQPPTLAILSPGAGTLMKPEVEVVVEAKDTDVARVEVAGRPAARQRPGIYVARLTLAEGQNTLAVVATDEAGNQANASVDVVLDTTPPDMTASVKVVVEGQVERGSAVFVDGQPVPVSLLGGWRVEVVVKKGQRTVEIVAIDANGNKRIEQRPIGIE